MFGQLFAQIFKLWRASAASLVLRFNHQLKPLNIPKVGDLVLMLDSGKCFFSKNVILVSSCPLYFMYLPQLKEAEAEPLSSLLVAIMENLPESFHLLQELRVVLLVARMQRRGASLIQGSCISVFVDCKCLALKVVGLVVLVVQLGQSVLGVHYWQRHRQRWRSQRSRPALGMFAAEANRWWFGCEGDSQDQQGVELTFQIDEVVDCAGSLNPCMNCIKRVSVAEHLYNYVCIKLSYRSYQTMNLYEV